MSSKCEPNREELERASARDASWVRQNLARVLFVHRSLVDVEHCLHELKRARFTVSSDVVVTPEQFSERLRSQVFDLIVAEYPSTNWQETQVPDLLRQMKKDIPLIFLVRGMKRETAAEFTLRLNRAVNPKWQSGFRNRATAFNSNFSASPDVFQPAIANLHFDEYHLLMPMTMF